MHHIDSTDFESEVAKLINQAVSKKAVLKQQRDALDRQIQEIEAALVSYEKMARFMKRALNSSRNHEAMSQDEREVLAPFDLSTKGRFACMTVPAALVRFFYDRENTESSISEIFDYVTANGLEIGGKDPTANLTATLHADTRFQAVRRGIYRLKPGVFRKLKKSGLKFRMKIEEVR